MLRSNLNINKVKQSNKRINLSLNKKLIMYNLKPFKQTKNKIRIQYRILDKYIRKRIKFKQKVSNNKLFIFYLFNIIYFYIIKEES